MKIPFSFESGSSHLKYEPLGGSSYISLASFLVAKKVIINLNNDEDECFKWAFNPVETHSECIDKKLRENQRFTIGRV